MAIPICRCLHKDLYPDAYLSKNIIILVDHIPFSLIDLGFKFCTKCEFFTYLESTKFCKCCRTILIHGQSTFESRRKRYQQRFNRDNNIVLKYCELADYSNMINETIPKHRKLNKYFIRKKTNKIILEQFIKNKS